jgi:hypothetical protein
VARSIRSKEGRDEIGSERVLHFFTIFPCKLEYVENVVLLNKIELRNNAIEVERNSAADDREVENIKSIYLGKLSDWMRIN